jgi:S-adenosylmethionine hydrolase
MADPIITLTTDFGEDSPYVAAVKGVILSINPSVRLVDLSHQIPPQDIRHAAFFLATALPCFPPGVIHLIVVDPGVGTERPLLHVEIDGRRLVVPDNGCWTELARIASRPPVVRRLAEPCYWRQPVSATFHGRDILGPVAAHLSLGIDPASVGPVVTEWVTLPILPPRRDASGLTGEVVFVDHFGNLITNIPAALLAELAGVLDFRVGNQRVASRVRTYGEAAPGTLVTLISSNGMVEFAVVQGSAARQLQLGVGTPVRVLAPVQS